MARVVHTFDGPERFVAGTVGQPGDRTFFLQARDGGRVVSVALEKMQVQLLAEKMGALLDEARRRGGAVPPPAAVDSDDVGPLDAPVEEEFRVGQLSLAWDAEKGVVTVEAMASLAEDEAPVSALDDTATEGPAVLRVVIAPSEARAFVRRAERVIAAGRPPCWLCGLPLDPGGHVCPRLN
jgi:uncharacterized repeat protein (TIGR03847 family)